MRNIGPVQSTNDYQYFDCPGTVHVSLQVLNAAAEVGFASAYAGNPRDFHYPIEDETIAPSSRIEPLQCEQIRFRSTVANVPATLSISCRQESDFPKDSPPGSGFSPSYLNMDSEGRVGAIFPGMLVSSGIEFRHAERLTEGTDNRVRWLRDSGAEIARMEAFDPSIGIAPEQAYMQLTTISNDDESEIRIAPREWPGVSDTDDYSYLRLYGNPAVGPVSSSVYAMAGKGAYAKKIISGDGTSDYAFAGMKLDLPLTSNWSNYGGTWEPCSYRKTGNIVRVDGAAKNTNSFTTGSANAIIAITPSGYRVAAEKFVLVPGTPGDSVVVLRLTTDGKITIAAVYGTPGASAGLTGAVGTFIDMGFTFDVVT